MRASVTVTSRAGETVIDTDEGLAYCRAGIGRSYQVPQPFGNMTVFENLVTAACFGGGQPEHEAWATAVEVLDGVHLDPERCDGAGRRSRRIRGGTR